MVTVACDLCGRTKEQLFFLVKNNIHRFERYEIEKGTKPETFDICELCLMEIRKKSLKQEASNEQSKCNA